MDTSVVETPWLSHSSRTRDVRGWLICIDLAGAGDLQDRSRVYGPLWSVPGSQSWLNYADGVSFSDEDRKAKVDAGFVAFDHTGEVVRIRHTEGAPSVRSALDLTPNGARWVPKGHFSWSAKPLTPGSEDRVQTPAHRYTMHRDDENGARLFETLSGERVEDPWLERAFEIYRGMKEMGNVDAEITNERDYLMCFVAPLWNRRFERDAPRDYVDTFEWNGTTYSREEWAFYFKRGSLEPVIFKKPKVEDVTMIHNGPAQALSINGELMLLYLAGDRVVLASPDSERMHTLDLPADPSTDTGYSNGILPFNIQHLPQANSIAFFATHYLSTNVTLHVWNYETGGLQSWSFDTTKLFKKPLFGLKRPHRAIPVANE